MLQGMLGRPDGGWPRKFQQTVLRSARAVALKGRPGAQLPAVDFKATARELEAKIKSPVTDQDVLSYVLYPQVYLEFDEHRKAYADTSVIPTSNFFYGLQPGAEIAVAIEEGKTLIIRFLTVGEVREDGTRTVFFELNGQPREVRIVDRAVDATLQRQPKGDPANPNHVAAPMPGKVSSIAVKSGEAVKSGDRLLSIEAMKMETAVYSPRDCMVQDVVVKPGAVVEAKDLLVVLQ
jgi:pyruvate carboxylase